MITAVQISAIQSSLMSMPLHLVDAVAPADQL